MYTILLVENLRKQSYSSPRIRALKVGFLISWQNTNKIFNLIRNYHIVILNIYLISSKKFHTQ